jgi:hypothetical protein
MTTRELWFPSLLEKKWAKDKLGTHFSIGFWAENEDF